MAPRSKKIRHDEETRNKIKAAQIINRLNGHVMGEIELSSTQVSSAKLLLGKVLPDLQAVTHAGDEENPLAMVTSIERVIVKASDKDT